MELETAPINKDTINLFTGRKSEYKQLDRLLKIYNIAIIEGDYGIGKTSLGNYYRFSKDHITPLEEISTDVRWNTKEFLNEVLKSLIEYCIKENEFIHTTHMQNLITRYKDVMSRDLDLSIMGNGVKYKENFNSKQIETQSGLIYDLKQLGIIASKHGKKLIVQLNNLDISQTDKKDIIGFFSQNRNIFQIPNVQWILTGSIGLTNLFSDELTKFASIIGKPLYIGNMDQKNLFKLIDKRINMDDNLKNKLIEDKLNLRDIINMVNIFKVENLDSKDRIKDYFDFFELNSYELEIINLLKEKPMSIKEIGKELNKSYNSINKRIKELRLKQAIIKKGSICYIRFEAYCSLII